MLTPSELARIEALEAILLGANLRANIVAGAIQNRSFVNESTTAPTSVTNSMTLGIAAVAATVKAGGIFLASVNIPWITGTNGDTITWSLDLLTGTGALAFTNGTQVANAGNVQVSNAAGGLSVATGAATVVDATFYQCTQPVLTGMLAGNFAWSGIVTNSNGTTGNEAAFPVGNNVVLLVRMNAAHSSTTAPSNVSLSLLELPYH